MLNEEIWGNRLWEADIPNVHGQPAISENHPNNLSIWYICGWSTISSKISSGEIMEVEEAREALHRRLEEVQTLEEEVGRCRKRAGWGEVSRGWEAGMHIWVWVTVLVLCRWCVPSWVQQELTGGWRDSQSVSMDYSKPDHIITRRHY